VKLVLGSYYLHLPGGTETYFATVADHLQRLGHDVTVVTRDAGLVAESMRDRGLAVVGPEGLPGDCDAILVHDAVCAYELAERYPSAPQLFVCHGAETDLELPPQLPGVVSAVVVMNERMRARVEAGGLDVDVVRLRQPIDYLRFQPAAELRDPPRQAVLLGHYLTGARRELIVGALERLGIRWRQLGRRGEGVADPAPVLAEADIVIGFGRSILEGMSAGCAAYVYEFADDGWVTRDSYPALEADGFAGKAFDRVADSELLHRDLQSYDPAMGLANRELIGEHHSAFDHATELAALLGRMAPRSTPADTRSEIARLVRLEWEAHVRAMHAESQLIKMTNRAIDAERQAHETALELRDFKRQRRYRMAHAVLAPLDRLRGRR
jgi:hypothetical protein